MDYPEFLNYMLLGANICLLTVNVKQYKWVMRNTMEIANIMGQAKVLRELWKHTEKSVTSKK